jgi:hypothetical protein
MNVDPAIGFSGHHSTRCSSAVVESSNACLRGNRIRTLHRPV